ncbi:MAG: hypothetical protein J3Q66DRAFT_443813 [Benniella sp.]|nr:MAG: hypothetical protein J3Q66DRAFT_443813 [Benniella sp.]
MTSTNINPLAIPEIRSMVGQHLRRPDLPRCSRVCKSWHASFVPLVWSKVILREETCSRLRNPPLEAFIRYSHYLKDLNYATDAPHEYRSTSCPNLLRLEVNVTRYSKGEDIDIVPIQIAQYEKLRYLRIEGCGLRSQRILWEPVHHHNLYELELYDLEIVPTCTATFWDLCTQLVSLKIEDVTVAEMPARSITFDRLQRLELELKSQNPIEHQLEWITQCPNLTSLYWNYSVVDPTSRLMRHFLPGTWPHLSELFLESIELTDAQLARVIGAMQDLKSLSVYTCEVGSYFLEALYHHSQTLTSLDATSCRVLTPSLVPKILASFPHLESLRVDRVMDQDIIDGLPWVCEHSLKKLSIDISFRINDADYHRQVLQRISRVTHLKGLFLDRGRQTKKSLHLSLDNGLDQLATLKQLEKLSFYFPAETLGVRDAEWMINNWKNLKKIVGISVKTLRKSWFQCLPQLASTVPLSENTTELVNSYKMVHNLCNATLRRSIKTDSESAVWVRVLAEATGIARKKTQV